MDLLTMSRLAIKHTENTVAESIYRNIGYDLTKPIAFYGLVNEHCNVKCRQCDFWRLKHYKEEMTIQEWQKALLSIKELVGEFSINFSGGEPFLKKGFVDLLAFCCQNGIHAGVTTNGSLMTRENAAKTVAARPFNVNFSVDAPTAELHDYLRGYPGLFDKLSNGLKFLREECDKQDVKFPIIVKPTINRLNFRLLPDIAEWAQQMGATAINFQPIFDWTREVSEELWIEKEEHEELTKVIEHLIKMKHNNAPIMNSEQMLRLIVSHFCKKNAPPENRPCLVGLRNFWIETDGNVRLCYDYPVIGNVKDQSAREIWYGEKAEKIRKQTLNCDKLCLLTCVSQKTLQDKVMMGLKLLKN